MAKKDWGRYPSRSSSGGASATSIMPTTIVELLRYRDRSQPDQLAYLFLLDGEADEVRITYGELDQKARAIAARLQSLNAAGDRALLLYPSGLDYIAAFFGCLYAGTIAVPAYPPRPAHLNRTLPRIQSIVNDAQPSVALTTSVIRSQLKSVLTPMLQAPEMQWLATDEIKSQTGEEWREAPINSDSLAFLQYTSGSTSSPRGVMVSHGNVLHNQRLITLCFQQTSQSLTVGWLPLYHDMGLIGNLLQPLYVGAPCILMAPASFLQSPIRWLRAISRYRAATSGGPNFAYELCLRKISAEQRKSLDLSSWTTAFNGAEPVRHETLERFSRTFDTCGFRREAFSICYGLAEATLMVSVTSKLGQIPTQIVQDAAIERHRVVMVAAEDGGAKTLLSCGRIPLDQQVVIVDPKSLTRCPADSVGEIWITGPSVTQGYWNQPQQTAQTFHAHLADTGEGPFLRTGDLGFLKDGELFVTGRLKDLIIIRGRNLYPQDIESTAERSHPALRPGCGAAFAIDIDDQEQLVLVQELEYRQQPNVAEVIETIRRTVTEEHEVEPFAIVLIKPGTISKTSSGKIQRYDCRLKFQAENLEVVAAWRRPADVTEAPVLSFDSDILLQETGAIENWLASLLAAKIGLSVAQIDLRQPIMRYGIDSMVGIELAHEIETRLGPVFPPSSFHHLSVAELAAQAATPVAWPGSHTGVHLGPATDAATEHPLSYGQKALWFLYQLAPESPAYNLAYAVRIRSALNVAALRQAFQSLVDRHASLRTSFGLASEGVPVQIVHDYAAVCVEEVEALAETEEEFACYLEAEANRPFSLTQGPLLRVKLLRRSSTEWALLLVLHHIIADFWSLAVFVDELGQRYDGEEAGVEATLPPLPLQYSDYVRWQAACLAGPRGDDLWAYWKDRLAGESLVLNLPTDRPRPLDQTYQGASIPFDVSVETTEKLQALCRSRQATLFMGVLAIFQVLLHRYTGQEDLLVGSLTAGRNRADLAGVMGYFVNPIVLRVAPLATLGFAEFLDRVRQTVLEAFEHQDYPFALLVERLQPHREPGRPPLLQAMLSFQQSPPLNDQRLASLALGEENIPMRLGGLSIESIALRRRGAQFEMTLMTATVNRRLAAAIEYNADLFDPATVGRMAGHFRGLLEAVVADPSRRFSTLPLLTDSEQEQMLVAWNSTGRSYSFHKTLPELFREQAALKPEVIAVVFGDYQLTYRELNRRSNQLARHLRHLGVGPEKRVGIFVRRSIEMIIGLLGTLKAGGAYVPLDPDYPRERLSFMLKDAGIEALVAERRLLAELPDQSMEALSLDANWERIALASGEDLIGQAAPENIAYIIYTSGSTGNPKGTMVTHRNVVNFCRAMDEIVGGQSPDIWLAVTSISFDISVLELLWTLVRGVKIIIREEQADAPSMVKRGRAENRNLDFSLFYFASDSRKITGDRYKLLIEGARFADQHGFSAVWTPERHFHSFGGLYPNPSVISAALAAITERIQIRAGSVVLPLHHLLRVAEEWSVVDNLSKGRIGISFASGWHADDFALAPENYAGRKEIMINQIETLRRLWRGESARYRGGAGNEIDIQIFPPPVQNELPIWITAGGSPETFQLAGRIGAGLLTHMLGQSLEELEKKIQIYRQAWVERHGGRGRGHVTLMLHTFIGEDLDEVREQARAPFYNYLRSSIGLIENLARSLGNIGDLRQMTEDDMQSLLSQAFDRYFQTSGLIGVPETCKKMIERLKAIGVDEVACLIDFGIEADTVLASLPHLDSLRKWSNEKVVRGLAHHSLAGQMVRHRVSHLQCTPSLAKILALEAESPEALQGLKKLLLGGEALPLPLARTLASGVRGDLHNMYGPTETTIWSTTDLVDRRADKISIGRPIANTEIYLVDKHLQPLPINVPGELYIGGEGVTRGYLNSPGLTAEKFIPDPFEADGSRLYRTGDLARYLPDGRIECLGRLDHQVKISGFRIELGEIETCLSRHPAVRETAVLVDEESSGEKRLVAYVVTEGEEMTDVNELRGFLAARLPSHMAPSSFVRLEAMPLTPNGKIDRRALLTMDRAKPQRQKPFVAPRNSVEEVLAGIWAEVLGLELVGIEDNFFELGGHSLLATRLVSRLRETFGIELQLRSFFQTPTVAGIAAALLEPHQQKIRVEKIAELLIRVAQHSEDEVEAMLREGA